VAEAKLDFFVKPFSLKAEPVFRFGFCFGTQTISGKPLSGFTPKSLILERAVGTANHVKNANDEWVEQNTHSPD